jgi:exodeoxyribonuclease VII small subunit
VSKNRQQTYSQALSELEKIVADIEAEEVDVDVLAEKIKKATHLMKFCRSRLRSAEEEVKKALSEAAETADTTLASDEESSG